MFVKLMILLNFIMIYEDLFLILLILVSSQPYLENVYNNLYNQNFNNYCQSKIFISIHQKINPIYETTLNYCLPSNKLLSNNRN